MQMFIRGLLVAIVACCPHLPSHAAGADVQTLTLRSAFEQARAGRLAHGQSAAFEKHPLSGWLHALTLEQGMADAQPEQAEALLAKLKGQPAGDWLHEAWLGELARREDWPRFLRLYPTANSAIAINKKLRCGELAARLASGRADTAWEQDAKALWLTASSLPEACDRPFAVLAKRGLLDEATYWQRIELAAADAQPALMRHLAESLPSAGAALANDYADFIESPHERYRNWPRDTRSRLVATTGLARQARRNPSGAENRLADISAVLDLDQTQRGKILAEIALWTVASYGEGSASKLAGVPESAYDERLHEWRVREAISRSDDATAIAGIGKMPPAQRNDARWQYFEARLRERQGQKDAARALYLKAAAQANFHGWLAADRLQQPYALCALEPSAEPALRAGMQANTGLQRAFALFAIDETSLALREWTAAVAPMEDRQRRLAIAIAQQHQWHDRGVFSIGSSAEDLRHYSLRFPLPYETSLRRQSQINGLDPAWVAGQTRAESIFMPTVTSAADARGLMQVLPATGEAMAKRLGRPWRGGQSLYEPDTNIVLGTAYLRLMLDRYQGLPYLAIAAYNAGPAPVARWQQARPALEPDLWIETIPYKETRDYVTRVLAFSVIYDWRLTGKALPVSDRLLGRFDAQAARRPFTCPTSSTGP